MQKYLDQLHEDIETSIRQRWRECPPHLFVAGIYDPFLIVPKGLDLPEPPVPRARAESIDIILSEIQDYINDDGRRNMYHYFDINKMSFPPVEKLNEPQLDRLVFDIFRLWAAYNYTASKPKGVPSSILYPILLKQMGIMTMLMEFGSIGIEFCSYNPDECPFGIEFCHCKEGFDVG